MQPIFIHLAYLLTEHNCVIIPDFGGFVVHRETSQFLDEEGIITAPMQTVGFNDRLIHSDGLLINSLMRAEATDYATAQARLEQFADHLRQEIGHKGEVTFPYIGKLSMTNEGKYRFDAMKETPANASMYGFTDVWLPLLSELQPVRETGARARRSEKDAIVIPINKRLIKTLASAAAIIVLFLMISTPIDNASAPKQYAGIIDSELIAPSSPNESFKSPQIAALETEVVQTEIAETEIQRKVDTQQAIRQETPPAADAEAKPVRSARTYYIIVAGTPVKSKAENLLASIRSSLSQDAEIIERDNMSRVYVAAFHDKKLAEEYVVDFRAKHPEYSDAWLLSVK